MHRISWAVALVSSLPLLACCSSDREREPAPRTPVAPSRPAAETAKEPLVFEGPGELLPREAGGLSISSPPRYFGPDNLYDLIDGGAEIYVEFGLVRMVTADYASPDRPGVTVTVEVYDMGSTEGAFGRVARFLEGRADPSAAGAGLPDAWADRGILGSGDLVAWRDRFLLHLTLLDESEAAGAGTAAPAGQELLTTLAGAVLARIGADPPPPADLARFPAEGRIPRSEAWVPREPAGIAGLGAGLSVRYTEGDREWTAFASAELADTAAAEAEWKTVLAADAPGRRIAIRVAGRRLVGAVAEGDQAPSMERLQEFCRALAAAFGAN